MDEITISPARYIQENGSLDNIATCAASLETEPLIITDEPVTGLVGDRVSQSFAKESIAADFDIFCGGCSQNEVSRVREKFNQRKYNVVIGIGGGKALDMAKAVAYHQEIPVMVVLTIASTDAPASSLAAVYTSEGQFSEYLFFLKNPDAMIMDTNVIPAMPAHLLVAGIGDALPIWFETRASRASGRAIVAGGVSTLTVLAIVWFCYTTLLENGYKAKVVVEQGVNTKAAGNIIGTNTYLSGIGFESDGLAIAHAIHNGMT